MEHWIRSLEPKRLLESRYSLCLTQTNIDCDTRRCQKVSRRGHQQQQYMTHSSFHDCTQPRISAPALHTQNRTDRQASKEVKASKYRVVRHNTVAAGQICLCLPGLPTEPNPIQHHPTQPSPSPPSSGINTSTSHSVFTFHASCPSHINHPHPYGM